MGITNWNLTQDESDIKSESLVGSVESKLTAHYSFRLSGNTKKFRARVQVNRIFSDIGMTVPNNPIGNTPAKEFLG